MLENRDYMRSEPNYGGGLRFHWSAWLVILIINVVVFFVEYGGGGRVSRAVFEYGALDPEGVKQGFVWQFLTFQFMHAGMPHLAFNLLALYFFGKPVEAMIGKSRFVALYLISGFMGGLLQVLLGLAFDRFSGHTVGASAGLCGLVAALAVLNPNATFYVMFILPVRALYFLPIAIVVTTYFLIFPSSEPVAHAAHLGGLLTGVAWIRLGWHHDYVALPWEGFFSRWRRWKPLQSRQRKRELVRAASAVAGSWKQPPVSLPTELPPEEFISREVDPILEKISAHGIHSLTDRERKILDAARKKMVKR
jgi:membrane associated rhomboid family serine protease